MRRLAIVLAVALSAGALTGCSGSSGGYKLTAYFDKAISLYPQSQVKVLGLRAGTVTRVTLMGDQVKVEMRIDSDVPVPEGATATLVPSSLIGERYVQLFPAWTTGQAKLAPNAEIPRERTSIPVEPDEALAALKHLLDTLDPNATGRLIKNLDEDLHGNGETLNGALKNLAQLSTTLADKDQQLVHIVDNFDKLNQTLLTRESQLGQALDLFATATSLLADERKTIESLVKNLGQLSTDGLDLVSEHGARLDKDLTILTRLLQSVNANMDRITILLDTAPVIVAGPKLDQTAGLIAAYDPTYHHIDLRSELTPTLQQLLGLLNLPGLGGIKVCLPVDVACSGSPLPKVPTLPLSASGPASSATATAPAGTAPAATAPAGAAPAATNPTAPAAATPVQKSTPIDGIVGLLQSPGADLSSAAAYRPAGTAAPAKHKGVGGWLRRTARSLVEAVA